MGGVSHQIEHLRVAGCTEIFTDEGRAADPIERPDLKSMVDILEPDDTVTVCDIKRHSGSPTTVIDVMSKLEGLGLRLEVLLLDRASAPWLRVSSLIA